jgi:hypothetical protein
MIFNEAETPPFNIAVPVPVNTNDIVFPDTNCIIADVLKSAKSIVEAMANGGCDVPLTVISLVKSKPTVKAIL